MFQCGHVGPPRIAKGDIIKADFAPCRVWQRDRCGRVAHLVFGPQQFDQAFGRPGGALDLSPDFAQGRDGTGNHDRVDNELDQSARAHRAVTHIMRANPQHPNNAREYQKYDNHGHKSAGCDPAFCTFETFFGYLIKVRSRQCLVRVCLNGLHRQQRLGCLARGRCDPILVFARQFAQPPPKGKNGNDHRGHDQQNQPRQLGRGQQHQHQPACENQNIAQGDGHRRPDDRLHQCRVGGDPAQNLAGHDVVKECRAHPDHPGKNRLADVGHNPFAQAGDKRIAQRRADGQQSGDPDGGGEILIQDFGFACAEIVHHAACGQRHDQRHGRRQDQRQKRQNQLHAIGRHEWPKARQDADAARWGAIPCVVFGGLGRCSCHSVSFARLAVSWRHGKVGSRRQPDAADCQRGRGKIDVVRSAIARRVRPSGRGRETACGTWAHSRAKRAAVWGCYSSV